MIKQENSESLQFGHRARLRKKFLDGQLTDYEIIELLLTYAIPRCDVRALSRRLHNKYKTIHNLLAAPFESLMENDGVKENTATFFKVLQKLMELEYKAPLDESPIFYNHEKLENYCKILLAGKATEEFHVFYLDGQYKLIQDELHSKGTVDWTAVYVREIVKRALDLNARSVVMLHNHPTPGICFSSEDINITKKLETALNELEMKLYDHFLVSGDIVYSARNMHLLKEISE